MTKKTKGQNPWIFIGLTLVVFLLLALFSFKIKKNPQENESISNINNAESAPVADMISLQDITSDPDLKWLYGSSDNSCLVGSMALDNNLEDFIWVWRKNNSGAYSVDPVNAGLGPSWIIKNQTVVWKETDELCTLGMEMDLTEGKKPSSHVWYVLNFKDSYVSGEVFMTKPSDWSTYASGRKIQ